MFAASKSGRAVSAVTTDPYFPYVPLLLNTTSTNGQQNNTFLDSSSNAFTITRNGTPTQGSFTPYQPSGYWSGYFNGSTDYLSIASNAALNLTADFTVETWAYATTTTNAADQVFNYGNFVFMLYHIGTTWTVEVGNGSSNYFTLTGTASLNAWHHFAITRSANTYTFWIDGVSAATTSNSNAPATSGATLYISRRSASNDQYFTGYISNFRIIKGTAVYTSAFTPPTTPLTAITNTSLLTLQSNRFIDNSTNAFAVTASGTPKVQAFQPFSPAASYAAATYGGSGYFNGSTDFLTVPSNAAFSFGTGDFTIEAWIYTTNPSNTNGKTFIDSRPDITNGSYWNIGLLNNGQLIFVTMTTGGVSLTSPNPIPFSQWVHVAATRASGTINLWVNGISVASVTGNADNISSNILKIGTNAFRSLATDLYFFGNMSNVRIVKGTAVYTGTFTPPTLAPLTTAGSTSAASYSSTTNVNTSFAASNTSLLTNFTNAGIYDAAWQNDALTVGDAQASTTQYKWSPTSMKFDGTGDYLTIPSTQSFAFGSGNWTIEAWVYLTANPSGSSAAYLTDFRGSNASNYTFGFIGSGGVTKMYAYSSPNGDVTGSQTVSLNAWNYVAYVRNGSTITIYLNGTSNGTLTTTYTQSASTVNIGSNSSGTETVNGYIQDLRITKGVARTITTPTAAFPTR